MTGNSVVSNPDTAEASALHIALKTRQEPRKDLLMHKETRLQ